MKYINADDYQIKWEKRVRGHLHALMHYHYHCRLPHTTKNTRKPQTPIYQKQQPALSQGVKYHIAGCFSETQFLFISKWQASLWGHWSAKTFNSFDISQMLAFPTPH